MSPLDRARAAHAAAEAAREAGADPRDVAALRAAAAAWERVGGPGLAMSTKGLRRVLRQLRVDVAVVAATAYARGLQNQDVRIDIERVAGKMLMAA